MIELALLSGFVIGAILAVFAYICYQFEIERTKWSEERQILLNRIQDPKYRPVISPSEKRADMEKVQQLREESEQFGLVGKIIE
jgi:Tfp pilus assembly protein PilE